MSEIRVGENESLESALKRFKRKCARPAYWPRSASASITRSPVSSARRRLRQQGSASTDIAFANRRPVQTGRFLCPGKKTDPRSAAKEGATRMRFCKIQAEGFAQLMQLQRAYKAEIGSVRPRRRNLRTCKGAIEEGQIQFYGCACGDELVACCSICVTTRRSSTASPESWRIFTSARAPASGHRTEAGRLRAGAERRGRAHGGVRGLRCADVPSHRVSDAPGKSAGL